MLSEAACDRTSFPTVHLSSYFWNWLFTVVICTTRFHVQKFYFLLTECLSVFLMAIRTNSDYNPILCTINWLVRITQLYEKRLYSDVSCINNTVFREQTWLTWLTMGTNGGIFLTQVLIFRFVRGILHQLSFLVRNLIHGVSKKKKWFP
jgi:hypothetical protein